MKELIIEIKKKTKVIKSLEQFYSIKEYKEQTFFDKLLLKDKQYPHIYFHQGSLTTKALDSIENSQFSIVNSRALKEQIEELRSYIKSSKIEVLYPYINTSMEYSKEKKSEFRELHKIEKGEVLFLFSSQDIELGGIDKFLEIIVNLQNKNYKLLFDIDSKDEEKLQRKLQKSNLNELRVILQKKYTNDELFNGSDICLFPTKQKLFLPSVPKAMYFKNAVFVMRENMASEIIDSFSLILGEDDRSVYFKVDALLNNKKERKKIQKENQMVVKNMTQKRYLEELQELIKFHLEL